jgi:hypothetical protein
VAIGTTDKRDGKGIRRKGKESGTKVIKERKGAMELF